MRKDYFLGLDMGTNSVGWAVTDKEYNILRKKGKDLQGARLFDEAESAEGRRTNRVSRRRIERRNTRIGFLKEIFADEINSIDPGFFIRLKDSKYFEEDKTVSQPFALFSDKNFTDKEYYESYPTIFHLRSELIKSNKPHDVRLVFLAILNIFKHRGHFLNPSLGTDSIDKFSDLYNALGTFDENFSFEQEEKFKEIFTDNQLTRSDKSRRLIKLLGVKTNSATGEIIKLVTGQKGRISRIFRDETFDDETEKISIKFTDSEIEEKIMDIMDILSDENQMVFEEIKKMYDNGQLSNLMKVEKTIYTYLSDARIAWYNKHEKDLNILKAVYKKYLKDSYYHMFRAMEKDNYSAYVGSSNYKGIVRRGGTVKQEDLYKRIKKELKNVEECNEKQYIFNEIEKENFLPKQLTSSNGVIPYQLHLKELIKILDNAETYIPFLKERDETGLTQREKIEKLFEFKIPYYVGPLNQKGKTAWVVRKPGKITPWNFEEKIDFNKSRQMFIERLVGHCTYLQDEKVLPKNSLLYEKFMVLNELNNLKINGVKLSVDTKQKLYNTIFLQGKKGTENNIKKFLKGEGIIDGEIIIEGIDGSFKNTCSNYNKFREVLRCNRLSDSQKNMAERIIFLATAFGDSKKILKDSIQKEFGEVLEEKQIKRICGMKFKDWGRFSGEFLYIEGADKETGEIKTIIDRMWTENLNLMQLLSSNYSYLYEIESRCTNAEKALEDIVYEDLEDLYISPAVRRMTWQTILIVKEIVKVMGYEPKKVFVEMAREHQIDKKRSQSRKNQLLESYKTIKKDSSRWINEIEALSETDFRRRKLYLYYMQMGRCMYTGEKIDLDDLSNNNLYDIDHIYPRHYIKDDSIINNLVLVKKTVNAHKSDHYPLESTIRRKMATYWKDLVERKLISREKYLRLIRTTDFTEEEKASFINRQIVETRQGTKFIADLFNNSLVETEVIYVKAGNVSDFRHKFDLVKCREVNDFHHAKDAYLNIVVGNTYNTKFTKNPINFIKKQRTNPEKYSYHMYKIFDYTVKRGDDVAWINEKNGKNNTIDTVKNMMKKNSVLVTYRNFEKKGQIAEQTIYSAEKAKKAKEGVYLPIKSTDERLCDVSKYGGYSSIAATYFFLVKYEEKGKEKRSIEVMPLYLKEQLLEENALRDYCENVLGYKNPVILCKKIKPYSLVKIDGFLYYITGKSNQRYSITNAVQLVVEQEYNEYIRKIHKSIDSMYTEEEFEKQQEKYNKLKENEKYKYLSRENNIMLYKVLIDKYNNSIYKSKKNSIVKCMEDGLEKFVALALSDQVYILKNIILSFRRYNSGVDLKLIGGAGKAGVSMVGKEISKCDEFKIINQSVTGLYEKSVDLLKL